MSSARSSSQGLGGPSTGRDVAGRDSALASAKASEAPTRNTITAPRATARTPPVYQRSKRPIPAAMANTAQRRSTTRTALPSLRGTPPGCRTSTSIRMPVCSRNTVSTVERSTATSTAVDTGSH
jgi:hypothetical protein